MLFGWEWILVILWSACCGIFGVMYRTENPEMDGGIQRMKTAFQFDWYVDCPIPICPLLTIYTV